ncbi:hypothetical protein DL96DRAFT_234823 [Flagelloscypha sp. PMI_526]|nr:hypothetical protein DL96DRAFT_234823 [Flagelloscypha sp. PMI_526]
MEQRSGSHVVLWIDGPLGAGKSALAHSVSKEASDKGFLASSFFMTPGSNAPVSMDQKSSKPLMGPPSIDNLVSTLIRDLAGKSDLFRDAVVKKLNEIPRFLTASPVVQLEHLLFPFVSSLSSDQRLLWVIDGFDELTRHERKDFSIYEVLDCLIQHASELRPYLMIFITARPFRNNPVEKLAAAAAHPDILWIPLDLSSRANASDLDIIAHQELTWLAQRNPSFECPDLHDPLTMAFRSRAGGLPLWLKVTRNFLERSFTPRRDLEQLVYDRALISPEYQQRINEMYAHVISETLDLRTSANQHHLRHVVFVLLAVQGPISPRTLNELFTGDSELPAEAVRSVLQCLRPLLLGLDNNHPIEFVHLSVRDFFQTSPTFGDLVQAPLSPRDLRKGHSMLLLRSFTVMAKELHAVASPDGLLSDSETLDQPLSPAAVPWGLQYGSSFWTQHILQVDPDFRSQDVRAALDDFFQEDFKDWLPLHAAIGKFKFTDKFIDDLKNVNDSWHGIAYKSLCNNSHAFLLDLVGQQLGDLDRLDERHQAQSQAVKSWRLLNQSKDGRGTYASELVNSLFRFSLAQTDIRLYDDAISMAEEAKTLSSQQPMERSMSLRVLSACLGAAGRWREALPPIVEAIRIQRSLLSTQVKEQHYLAKPLNYLSECSYRLGRSLAPITAAKEARKIYKRLSKEGAQSFTKDLASTASQLHILFHSRHQNYHALGAGKEAIRLYKQLAEKKPQKFNIFLAKELTGHALDLEMLERYRDALPHAEEAIRLFREMTSAETPWDHELAVALFLLARLRKELDPAPTAALEAVREAITLGERVMQSGGNESWKVISPKMWWWLLQSLELGVLLETKSLILEWEKEWERKNMVFWITSQHKPWLKEGGRFATWALKRLDRESKGRVSPWINRVLQLRKEFEDTEQKEESRVVRVDGNSDSSTSEEEEHNETDSDEREAASILPPIQDPDSDASSVAPPPIPEPDSSAEEGPPGPVPVEADTEESDDWASSSESLANAEEMRTSNESSSDEEVIYPAPDHLRPPPDNDEFWFSDEEEREEEERKKTVGLMRVEASWYAPSLKSPNLPTLRSEIRQSLQYGPSWNKGKNKGKLTHGLQRTDTTRTFSLYSNF